MGEFCFKGNFRATKGYKVESSMDAKSWTELASGELEDARKMECRDIPFHEIAIEPTLAKYVRFTMKSYYGYGGGLEFFALDKEPAS